MDRQESLLFSGRFEPKHLSFTGFVLVTGWILALLVPAIMTLSFVFLHIPTLDLYLAKRYGEEFETYTQGTSRLLPGLW